jgi:hypothetical protein
MIKVISDAPQVFKGKSYLVSDNQTTAMNMMASAIVDKRPKTIELLSKYSIALSQKPSNQELLSGLILGFKKYPEMVREFADPSFSKFSNLNEDGEKSSSESADGGSTLGFISGIIGGVGDIIGLFGHADSNVLAANANSQILALIAEKEKARRRNNIIAIVTVALVLIGSGVLIYVNVKNKKNAGK